MRAGGADLTVLSSPSGRPTWPRLSRAVSQGAPLVVVTSTRTELSGLRAMWTSSPWYRQLPISHPTLVSSSLPCLRFRVPQCRCDHSAFAFEAVPLCSCAVGFYPGP